MKRGEIRNRLAICASGAALVLMGALAGSSPARAFDDRPSTFEPLLGAIGLGNDSEDKPAIDYRERPKLVVPKGAELPPPQASANARAANWPQDPDIQRRRAAAAAERAPRAINPHANPVLTNDELRQGRSTNASTAGEPCETRVGGIADCSVLTPVDKLKRVFTLGSTDDKDVLVPGVEPSREYLTEPPPGYRKATTETKANSAPRRKYQTPTEADYARGFDPNKTKDD